MVIILIIIVISKISLRMTVAFDRCVTALCTVKLKI